MAYQSGSYASLELLCQALKGFAEAAGWATHLFADFRGGKRLSHSNADGVYLHWYSANNVQIAAGSQHSNGVYTGDPVTGLVLHAGTGYDGSKDPAWQPGVPNLPGGFGAIPRHHFWSGTIPVSGQYHFVAGPGLLAVFLDIGQTQLRYFIVAKTLLFAGGAVQYVASASCGAGWGDDFADFLTEDNLAQADGFSYHDATLLRVAGSWSHEFRNENGMYSALYAAPYVSPGGEDFSFLLVHSGLSGVTGVRTLYPAILFERVSDVFRPHAALAHVAKVNGRNYAPTNPFTTSSGAWRAFVCGPSADDRTLAVRTDL